jgi:hypothetical protein
MHIHVNVWVMQVGPLTGASECDNVDLVPGVSQEGPDLFPTPSAIPHAMNKNEVSHDLPCLSCVLGMTVWNNL